MTKSIGTRTRIGTETARKSDIATRSIATRTKKRTEIAIASGIRTETETKRRTRTRTTRVRIPLPVCACSTPVLVPDLIVRVYLCLLCVCVCVLTHQPVLVPVTVPVTMLVPVPSWRYTVSRALRRQGREEGASDARVAAGTPRGRAGGEARRSGAVRRGQGSARGEAARRAGSEAPHTGAPHEGQGSLCARGRRFCTRTSCRRQGNFSFYFFALLFSPLSILNPSTGP